MILNIELANKILIGEEIRRKILEVFAGYYTDRGLNSKILILSPWISNVQVEISSPLKDTRDDYWYHYDYRILSIDLAHALLLMRLYFGAQISLITQPPTNKAYPEYSEYVKLLLDFLDECGCEIYLNPQLHSKLILADRCALIGSLNLTKSALYDREELMVFIDDLESLAILEGYFSDIKYNSNKYGYSTNNFRSSLGYMKEKLTRGDLVDNLCYYIPDDREHIFDMILTNGPRPLGIEIEEISSNLDLFYQKVIKILLKELNKEHFKPIFVRDKFPNIRLKIVHMGDYTESDF